MIASIPAQNPSPVALPRVGAAGVLSYVWHHPANRGRRVSALARALGWQAWKRITGRPLTVGLAGGLRIVCHPGSSAASSALYCRGRPDWDEMGFMLDYLRPGDGFLDVGANIGVYTLVAASRVGENGRLHVFEPGAEALARLRENLALNALTGVRLHPVAAGEAAGRVSFSTGADTMNRLAGAGEGDAPGFTSVECRRLDDELKDEELAMGKMDVEGAEPIALRGAEALLARRSPPVWLLEMNGLLRQFGETEEGLAAWLAARGYDLALYDADRRVLRLDPRAWERAPNVLALARDRLDALAARCGARVEGRP